MNHFKRAGFKGKAFRIIGFLLLIGIILPFAVTWLWNFSVATTVDGVATINYWQGMALLVLARILFGGFGPRPGGPFRRGNRLSRRWKGMSEEEKTKFKEEWKRRCGPSES